MPVQIDLWFELRSFVWHIANDNDQVNAPQARNTHEVPYISPKLTLARPIPLPQERRAFICDVTEPEQPTNLVPDDSAPNRYVMAVNVIVSEQDAVAFLKATKGVAG